MHEYLDRRYALAFYEVVLEKGKAEECLKELSEVVEIINGNQDLLQLIRHPGLNNSKKKQLIESVFKGKIEGDILSFLFILIDKDRILELDGILEEIKKIHLERINTVDAYVKTVIPLTDEERTTLIEKLQKKYDKNIILKEEIDESIIGGIFIRVGNDIIDGTIKLKYDEMKKKALKTE